MTELPPLRIALAHGVADARDAIQQVFTQLNLEDVWICATGRELIETACERSPDLIITGVDLPDMDGPTALITISESRTVPAIIVTRQRSLDLVRRALDDHVMAYLLEPVNPAEILPTVYLVLRRFEQFKELEAENESLKQALADRKLIERAKGALMKRAEIDEETAYKRLRRYATDHRIRMADAAQVVLSADELFEP